ncbi:NAD-dependent epimerase/dehydratase family protein [Leptospira barantonii]|uniref:UDP-glucose 4-epimerase n=1 Tax=Leptospira barantonii TaxID=2023184 RepID=A0ABX4NMW5_9LEPT|nr:SDR family oxidoreductase [Leptospira barantonii]PJZ58159.1 UDP-glucose 4-epimerase [Leptospira barantonii]
MTRKKILITGASGLLGGRIAKYFGELDEFEINLATSKKIEFPDSIRFGKFVSIDWNSGTSLEDACDGVEFIVHCAGMNAQDATRDPQAAIEFNGRATGRLLDAAIRKKSSKFVYFSTAHVYGSPLEGDISEDSPLTNPHPYAMSNLEGEKEVNDRTASGKISGFNIRLSNAFGAPADPNVNCWTLLVNDLCRQAVTTGRMVLKTTGLQRRDFIPITDVCNAVYHIFRIQSNLNPVTYNLGGNKSMTVWEMANLVRERCGIILGFLPILERVEPGENETSADFNYDTAKLRSTGFLHSNSFESEIDDLIKFCKQSF